MAGEKQALRDRTIHTAWTNADLILGMSFLPGDKCLHFQYTSRYPSDNAYQSERRNYKCFDCTDCPLKSQCTKGNRKIRISFCLLEYRIQARENLTSEE